MIGETGIRTEIQDRYAAGGDPSFEVVRSNIAPDDDRALADLIEADGRFRQQAGLAVPLSRYLNSVGDLLSRTVPLDAAIDVTLRWLSGGSHITSEAINALVAEHPYLRHAINEAAALGNAVWSTRAVQSHVAQPPPKDLPSEFGPPMADGPRRYQLQRLLGEGAFGRVYLALDRQLSQAGHTAMVAIKIAAASHRSPWFRQRAIEEAARVRRINHPNVVTVHDRGVSDDDEDFTVYQYVDGGDLARLLATQPVLPTRTAASLMARIARGVHAAHAAGVIHCDLKPGNIMLTTDGEPKVVDFGIAVGKGDGQSQDAGAPPLMGNLAFISPEQCRGDADALSVPSDIFALGSILFNMLTGRLPNGSSVESIRANHALPENGGRTDPPSARQVNPRIDRDLDLICQRAMSPSPADRYASAAAFADDLEHWLNLEPIRWTRPGVVRMVGLWSRRKPALAGSVLAIIVLLIAGSAVAGYLMHVAQERRVARLELEERERRQAEAARIGQKFVQSLQILGPSYRLNTEALVKIWVFEYVFGPTVLDLPDLKQSLWPTRITVLRNLVDGAHANGRAGQFETMLLESLLAFWLVSDGDHEQAISLLDGAIPRWSKAFGGDDPWIADLRTIRVCAEVNRVAQTGDIDAAGLAHLNDQLVRLVDHQAGMHRGTPLHFLALRTQAALYGPSLLNQPERAEEVRKQLEALMGAKPKGK